MADTNLSNLIVNLLTRKAYHAADLTDHGNELFVQSDHAGVHVGASGVDGLDTTNISNCITEIPQDINLELNNGTLTLKSGSVITETNGTQSQTTQDISTTISATGKFMIFKVVGSNTIQGRYVSEVYSGSSTYTGSGTYYNTTDNDIWWYANGTKTYQYALPLCIVTVSNGAISSIDQVFNGFGYIGSSRFALPGVKGLIPNGRNADGTLKTTEFNTSSVIVRTDTNSMDNAGILFNGDTFVRDSASNYKYDPETNYVYLTTTGAIISSVYVGTETNGTNGAISNFNYKNVFHAVDYNDAAIKEGNNIFTGSNEFTQTVKAPSVYGYGSDSVRTASLEFIDGGNDNIARLVAVSNNGSNAATADLHFNNGSPYFSVPSSDAVNAAVATLANTKAQNGYFKLSNGLIIQWGSFDTSTAGQAITFPTAFTSASSYSLAFSLDSTVNTGGNVQDNCINTRTSTGFTTGTVTRTGNAMWIAIGY